MDANVPALVAEMKKYRTDGQIVQRDRDKGDSLNRVGVYYSTLLALGATIDDQGIAPPESGLVATLMNMTEGLPFGRFRRGLSATERWFNNPDNVTRDQMVPIEAALALANKRHLARAHFWLRARRFFFHFSTQDGGADGGPLRYKLPDVCTPSEFGTLVRATRYRWLYFVLPFTDLFLLLDVYLARSLNPRSLYDADNQLLPQVLAAIQQPTFVTEFVRRAYAQTDAVTRLQDYYAETEFQDYLGHYQNGIVPLGELTALAFERAVGGLSDRN